MKTIIGCYKSKSLFIFSNQNKVFIFVNKLLLMEINDRLRILMDNFQLSSSQFADKLEIQRSAISHLLSGRNKPSILILEKILKNFPDVDIEWLITGKGNIFKSAIEEAHEVLKSTNDEKNNLDLFNQEEIQDSDDVINENDKILKNVPKNNQIEKIIIIFQDKTFEILEPKTY